MRRRLTGALLGGLVAVTAAACASPSDEPAPWDEYQPADDASSPEPGTDETDPGTDTGTDTATDVPDSFTLTVSGDVLLHSGTWVSAEMDAAAAGRDGLDFGPMLAGIEPLVSSADLAVCHLETPLAEPGGPYADYPLFDAPPQIVPALQDVGFDACTTASNHTVDQGFEGLARTVRTLDRAGLPHTGSWDTRRASQRPLVLDVEGIGVGLLSYTYGTNGMPVEQPWSVPLIDPDRIVADAARAKDAGADVVVVALHDGVEYVEEPSETQVDVVDEITRSPDIDLVYGHHAHVSQPFDVVNGTWVAYGLGNMIAQQSTSQPETYRGTTATFELARDDAGEWDVDGAWFTPTQITGTYGTPMRVLDAPRALADPDTPADVAATLRTTIAEVTEASYLLGARRDGLQRTGAQGLPADAAGG